ncbi:hypothetical protein MWT71_001081 [Vibrio parahaemolyticus]|uniref:hypothetical protein n=1 Tax=Vibrio sp. J2-4 TaxID=1507977 RepID=UPI0015B61045|nr:hypothetical protein [Vibrio sp. J2-4]EGQ8057943.1 hypothetical protein [Vibrio parahaemolyticus]EGR0032496.1 hypothetical protein [Vibrio parahaemolyticus]EHH1247929.1 hypothetical protein [Vibrio parahaemolyticus]EHW0629247.1 hypothetical protein [Vibrio parahaemolyticus]EJA3302026.1 hypothetical protein [Vibrio parahaemolyticus]
MDYTKKINCSFEEMAQDELITDLVDLSIVLYKKYLESNKIEQHCMLISDCNDNELIELCYRVDFVYFYHFELFTDQLIETCYKQGYPVVLNEISFDKCLLPQDEVNFSEFTRVLSEEMRKLSLKVAQIECIALHPSLQRKGIFTRIVKNLLDMEECESVIVTNINNDSWFKHLKKNATETSSLLSSRAVLFN